MDWMQLWSNWFICSSDSFSSPTYTEIQDDTHTWFNSHHDLSRWTWVRLVGHLSISLQTSNSSPTVVAVSSVQHLTGDASFPTCRILSATEVGQVVHTHVPVCRQAAVKFGTGQRAVMLCSLGFKESTGRISTLNLWIMDMDVEFHVYGNLGACPSPSPLSAF